MLPQSSWIAAFLGVGFVVFITARGELPSYLSVLLGTSTASSNTISPAINAVSDLSEQTIVKAGAPTTLQPTTPTVSDTIPMESLQGFTF